jgi:ribulose-phosphate 3-epimerase
LIQVDGGINGENANIVAKAGADILVAGAGVFKTKDYKKAIENLRCSGM